MKPKYELYGQLSAYTKEGIIREPIQELFDNKEEAKQRKRYWEKVFKQYENVPENSYITLIALKDDNAAERDVEVTRQETKIILTYLEMDEHGMQNITTKVEDFSGSGFSYALKRMDQLNEEKALKERGSDKRIIHMELKTSLSWGATGK